MRIKKRPDNRRCVNPVGSRGVPDDHYLFHPHYSCLSRAKDAALHCGFRIRCMRSGYIGGEHLEQERTEGIYGKSRMGENGGVPYFIITAYIAVMTAAGYLIATPAALYVLTTMFAGGGSSTLKGKAAVLRGGGSHHLCDLCICLRAHTAIRHAV